MNNLLNFIVKDSAMLISNSEYVLEKPVLLHDDFESDLDKECFLLDENDSDDKFFWRLKRVFYRDDDDIIYLLSCYFEYTDNQGDVNVEYIKMD